LSASRWNPFRRRLRKPRNDRHRRPDDRPDGDDLCLGPETKDFWRKTTNIIKPDGNRAVGTPLGQKGAVYPVLTKGETFRGEAVILGTPYYTIYEPIFPRQATRSAFSTPVCAPLKSMPFQARSWTTASYRNPLVLLAQPQSLQPL
jgi:hypothetical protein